MTDRRPVKTQHHLAKALHPSPSVLKEAMGEAKGFNAKFAVLITRLVGTMWCAYLFACIALIGLGPALKPGGEGIVAWIAQTFLQLVLLSVIMVGQNVQSLAADARSANTFKDAEEILDRLDIHTQGGLKAIIDRLDEIAPASSGTGAASASGGSPGASSNAPKAS
ncbi:MAG TPA: hypothetical protein VIJ39_06115 [Solirubrobacteraceae bacterium]